MGQKMIQEKQADTQGDKQKRAYRWKGNEHKWCKPLRDYVLKLDPPQQAMFAKKCGTTLGNVKLMMYGERGVKERFAIAFDRESNGEISMFDVLPDVDWMHVAKAAARHKRGKHAVPG